MTTRRSFIALLGAAALTTACPVGPTTPDGGAGSSFVTTAGNILANLDRVLAGLTDLPSSVATAVSIARASIGVAQNALGVYARGVSTCADVGGAVATAIRSTLSVIDALTASGVAVPTIVVIGLAGASTILDQVVGIVCGPATDSGTRDIGGTPDTVFLHRALAARGIAYPVVPATLVAAPIR